MMNKKKLSIIAFSGDFDKLTAVFTLATGAAAVGYEVNIRQALDYSRASIAHLATHEESAGLGRSVEIA